MCVSESGSLMAELEHKFCSSDSDTENSSAEESEPQSPNNGQTQSAGVSEYEEQRLSRIAENRARMEALGLNKISSSFMGSAHKSPIKHNNKGKGKMVKDKDADEDYKPNVNEEDDDDDDEDFVPPPLKVKNKGSKSKVKLVENPSSNSDYIDEDDELQQAIALSLKESAEAFQSEYIGPPHCSDRHAKDGTVNDKKGNSPVQEDTRKRKKRKTPFTRRVQMTEDELVVHFCQFDEEGKGSISGRDVRKIAAAHDFEWTDKEIRDMVYCFDSNGDGKLSFEDFQKIVRRCNMIQGSGNS